jgi:glycosyltransferase involved in cell wall biosynthesis
MGKEILAEGRIDAIYSTSSPPTAHLIARRLCREKHLPWIADFRDPWLDNFDAASPTVFHRRLIARLEQAVCLEASALTVVSEPMRLRLLKSYPDLPPGNIITIPNGYDPADLAHAKPVSLPAGAFHLVYTGSFYARNRSPDAFLAALKRLIDSGAISQGNIRVHLIGNAGKAALQKIAELHLGDVVIAPGYLPHAESVGYLLAADALLLVIGSDPGSEVVFTGKLFEYLAARRPILALAPPGPAASLIQEAQAGSVVDPDDVDAIAAALLDYYLRWEQGGLRLESRDEVIERYDRRRLTSRLANLLDSVTGRQALP